MKNKKLRVPEDALKLQCLFVHALNSLKIYQDAIIADHNTFGFVSEPHIRWLRDSARALDILCDKDSFYAEIMEQRISKLNIE